MKDDLVYIRHIQDSIDKISRYIGSYSYEDFVKDEKTVDAVVRNIEIIGEAAAKCSNKFKGKYPDIPWRVMKDARNRLIHNYADIVKKVLWGICKDDLPVLKNELIKHFGNEY